MEWECAALPERHRNVSAIVTQNINVKDLLAYLETLKLYNVELLQRASNVIAVINFVLIEPARCSPQS